MKVFGYSISINVLILLGILYLIMVVNALSASCNREGLLVNPPPKPPPKKHFQDKYDAAKIKGHRAQMSHILDDAKEFGYTLNK